MESTFSSQLSEDPCISSSYSPRFLKEMWKKACDNAEKCIVEAKLYNKQRYGKSHRKPDFKEGNQVLISILNLNNPKGPNKMRNSFLGPLTIIRLLGKNAVKVRLTEKFSRKHLVFPVSLVEPYHQIDVKNFVTEGSILPIENWLKKMIHLDQCIRSSKPEK
ncbi:hypothetical protein O181_027217 [Austropuccinia psidii MF-1]|uniref:Uncharacterized protein n=1 Tax=Austropuccinia psidii MF-1 TaxID=1389203 RepID=A0A9Q3CS65_9BASI|nr:hypothetical protein [Austropuccinia psidii MF-1]